MRWAFTIAAKVALSQIRVPYGFWRRFGLFRHGAMDAPDYALKIFDMHLRRAFPAGNLAGKTILEIGPGDSLASAFIGKAYGAAGVVLVDVGAFATDDLEVYRSLIAKLSERHLVVSDLENLTSTSDALKRCGATYLVSGVDSFLEIESASIDYIWSHSVLEHIPKKDLRRLFSELRRILKPDGVMSHNIDFQDHLQHSLNSLRFSELVWESKIMRNAGFYTNRVRAHQMHGLIQSSGFVKLKEGFGYWEKLPIPEASIHADFRNLDREELLIRTSHILVRPDGYTSSSELGATTSL